MNPIEQLHDIIEKSDNIVFFGGAGEIGRASCRERV